MFGIKAKTTSKTTSSWDSGLEIIRNVDVVVPLKLLLVCDKIASKMNGDEFSIVSKIDQKLRNTIYISEEYYIPKQIVSAARIEYEPDEYNGYDVVIHRHPNGCNGFSGTDMEYINQNFKLSLLYTREDGFVRGLYNLKISETEVVQLPVEISIHYGSVEVDTSNIKKETFTFDSLGKDFLRTDTIYEDLFHELEVIEFEEEKLKAEGGKHSELAELEKRKKEIESLIYIGDDLPF